MTPARTIFLGSGSFAVPILEAVAAAPDVDLVMVVTAPPRPAGRGLRERPSPIANWVGRTGAAPFIELRRLRDELALAQALRPDLIALADYGQLVPPEWLAIPTHGALNVHPSLLPRHRGASPIPAAILAGDPETGVTLMRMDEGLDTGPVVAQRRVLLRGDEVTTDLEARLAREGAQLLGESLAGWLDGTLKAAPQPDAGATLTRPLKREDGRLDPARTATELERQVRAYQPWPGSFLEAGGDRLVVWKARVATAPRSASAGSLVATDGGLGLVTANGVLELLDVQRAGGKRMSGAELVRGNAAWIGRRVDPTPRAG